MKSIKLHSIVYFQISFSSQFVIRSLKKNYDVDPMIIALITAIVVDVIQLTGYKCKYFVQVLLINILLPVYVLLNKQKSLFQNFESHQRLNCNVVKLLNALFCCCQLSDNIYLILIVYK